MKGQPIKISTKRVWMHKAINNPDFAAESVLSNDPWLFVELWLKRNKKEDALAFWLQARRFSESARMMSVESAPLTLYYAFLNATKALLLVHSQAHGSRHGVSGARVESAKTTLANEIVEFKSGGILPALCSYFGESATSDKYDLKSLLWNLPYVHRAFRHTFTSEAELFIPLENVCYVSKENTSEAWFQAQVVPRYTDGRILRHLPASFEAFEDGGITYVRRPRRFRWLRGTSTAAEKGQALARLCSYHATTRRVVVPITGNRDLWYLKKAMKKNRLTERHGLTIIFAAMHRLSELARYDPKGLEQHLCGKANWLLSEFVEHSSDQFIDQMASEITGFQFWRPRIRS